MAFYLKKTKLKGRTYLSIDESFYSHETLRLIEKMISGEKDQAKKTKKNLS